MIGEFVPAQHSLYGPVLLAGVYVSGDAAIAVVADRVGQLQLVNVEDLSIDWHYDEGEGEWRPDFPKP